MTTTGIKRPYLVFHIDDNDTTELLGDAKTEREAMMILERFVATHGQWTGYVTYTKIVIKYQPARN